MTEQEDRQGIFQQKIKCVFLPPEEQPAPQDEQQQSPEEQPVVAEHPVEADEPVTVSLLFIWMKGGIELKHSTIIRLLLLLLHQLLIQSHHHLSIQSLMNPDQNQFLLLLFQLPS